MRTKLSLTISTLAALCLAIDAYSAPWSVRKCQDDITDEIVYNATASGSELSGRVGSFCPMLIVRLKPTGRDKRSRPVKYDTDVFLWSPALKRKTQEASVSALVRFDKDNPEKITLEGSDNRCALFFPDGSNTYNRILSASKLAIRFTLGKREQTTIFNIANLKDAVTTIDAPKKNANTKSPGSAHTAKSLAIVRRQTINAEYASIEAEEEARAYGYYDDVKTKYQSKHLSNRTAKPCGRTCGDFQK